MTIDHTYQLTARDHRERFGLTIAERHWPKVQAILARRAMIGRKVIINGKTYQIHAIVEDKRDGSRRTHLLTVHKPNGKKCWIAALDIFSGQAWLLTSVPGVVA